MTLQTREAISKRIRELRESIRLRMPQEMRLLEAFENVISAHSDVPEASAEADDYSQYRFGSDALVAYLMKHGRTKRLTAIRQVAASGWGVGKRNPRTQLRAAIAYQASGTATPRIGVDPRTDEIFPL